jgi:hypothetical protein
MYRPSGHDPDETDALLGEALSLRIRSTLDPTEYLIWADRPVRPAPFRLPFLPALFVSVLAGLSGFSLAAMFGLIGDDWIDLRTLILALGLGPCVLGGMIAMQLLVTTAGRWLLQRRLARLVYCLTDRRAIVARLDGADDNLKSESLQGGEIADTRRFENPDGSGDLYFLGWGQDQWLPLGFLEVRRVGLVETLVRETLLETEGDWWKLGPSRAF